jgi:hypothetical protein
MNGPVWRWLKGSLIALGWLVGILAIMQLVPYGRTHSNPPIVREPAWASPRVRELAVRVCFDCHSNETRWPWYADLAPFSWVVQFDVETARSVINFSEWNRPYPLAVYAGNSLKTGNMPPIKFRLAHPEAELTPQETRDLVRGLDAMLRPDGR